MLALTGVCVEVVPRLAEVVVFTSTLAGVTVPPVNTAVVTNHFLTGQAG